MPFILKTTISDAEVSYEDKEGFFYHIKYRFEDSDKFLEIATTRPETLFWNAVAVNPEDDRYKEYIGKNLVLPISENYTYYFSSYVDMEFGSGVVKITPAHDPNILK